MREVINNLGQPVGPSLPDWKPPAWPSRETETGRLCRLEPLDVNTHAAGLHAELAADAEGRTWTYLPYGPFNGFECFRAWLASYCLGNDPLFYTIIDVGSGGPLGLCGYLRINPAAGVIEV